jgi:hypothetical protein
MSLRTHFPIPLILFYISCYNCINTTNFCRLPFDPEQLEIPAEDLAADFPQQPQGYVNNDPSQNNPLVAGKGKTSEKLRIQGTSAASAQGRLRILGTPASSALVDLYKKEQEGSQHKVD